MTAMLKKRLPVGIENFEKIRRDGFYYVDKTDLIKELLENWGEVNLFTRPRRFGKTLNMSMFQCFFEIGCDKSLFDGLRIAEESTLCETYMGKFPVISISLKGIDAADYETARNLMVKVVNEEARRFQFLTESNRLTDTDKMLFGQLLQKEMDDETLFCSLRELTELLRKHYEKQVIVLIDEYDVPLAKANELGYYDEMVRLIRRIFGSVLKTNHNLYFAVLTGCLRVTKESIFTGVNNFNTFTITDVDFDEYFGFTDAEVKEMLEEYQLGSSYEDVREWYDGYRFGNVDVYCPWDVINHVDRLCAEPDAEPQSYWINSSGNDLVKRFVDKADKTTRDELERLIAGETIEKQIRLELTYDEIDNSIDHLWSVLFTTGYLTKTGKVEKGVYQLVIPNKEVREVYVLQIQEWFRQTVQQEPEPVKGWLAALEHGEEEKAEQCLNRILGNTISIFDTKSHKNEKEIFYHGILLGLLRCKSNWLIRSNVESGDGFVDILIEPEDPDAGIIIELKYAQTFAGLENACEKALAQIREKRYEERLREDGREKILAYGIAFYKKRCKMMVQKI